MIPRYTLEPMSKLWVREETKYEYWLKVELAVLAARAGLGQISSETYLKIGAVACINVRRILEIEEEIDHDLLAFVNQVQEVIQANLGSEYANEFHRGLTSFDTEDPAYVLMLREAVNLVLSELNELEKIIITKAKEYKWALMIARTHGQYAEPDTFGHLLLVFANEVGRVKVRVEQLLETELKEAKISGAVGNYAGLDPAIEREALKILGLVPANAETQIMQRDRYSTVINTLAVAAGVIEQIARTFWEMMRSDCRELEEPRRKKQKGSSAMAHKKNPILTERMMGMARLVRGYAHSVMESISTPEWRAIEQSCVERVAVADAFILVHYMVSKYRGVVQRLTVFEQNMFENLNDRTRGVWAGQQVRNKLMAAGVDYETAYRYVQQCSFDAVRLKFHVIEYFKANTISDEREAKTAEEILGAAELESCFDAKAYIEKGINHIFKQVQE